MASSSNNTGGGNPNQFTDEQKAQIQNAAEEIENRRQDAASHLATMSREGMAERLGVPFVGSSVEIKDQGKKKDESKKDDQSK
ncbi:hypothetical protein J4E86_005139 [Alternaria arbusti]|uniref:uncharacterized protein n=1 Tax=Alternaria arbusti TaxID=232088 RepID=UPI00221EA6A5|nr:uncharacterized protein J4E86_005139 [Alternaria arbusti]KAI4957999.1 hypothetical protein J4E86_005139 [Alternaria arbusti]